MLDVMKLAVPEDPPPRSTTQAQRRRVVELMYAADGLPPPIWRRERRDADQIDLAPLVADYEAARAPRRRRYEAFGLLTEKHDQQVRCKRCREILVEYREGVLVGVTPSAIYMQHAIETGCR
jgi:hypothetical protein